MPVATIPTVADGMFGWPTRSNPAGARICARPSSTPGARAGFAAVARFMRA
jgi:hypothetical protein